MVWSAVSAVTRAVDGRFLILSDHLWPMGSSFWEFVLPQYIEMTQKRDPGCGVSGHMVATLETLFTY